MKEENELPLGRLLWTPAVNEIWVFSGAYKARRPRQNKAIPGSCGSGIDDLEVHAAFLSLFSSAS